MRDRKKGKYRHFKGKEYQLLYVARHSETQEEMIVYRALYGDRGVWVRPASMWDEAVEQDGILRPRFQWISETDEEGSCRETQGSAGEGAI
ncbi:MAG: DUF1653 domain-containing protein [Oscillospiraceae bacterium]|jgi:hypothetical protein